VVAERIKLAADAIECFAPANQYMILQINALLLPFNALLLQFDASGQSGNACPQA
jgi:hypothetical protein